MLALGNSISMLLPSNKETSRVLNLVNSNKDTTTIKISYDPDKIRSEMQAEEERKKINAIQTKIKKAFEKAIEKYQVKDEIYKRLGTNVDQFVKDYNNSEKQEILLEQLELLLKGD